MLLTFVDKHGKDDPTDQTFRRITKDEMKDKIVEDIPLRDTTVLRSQTCLPVK